MTVTWTSGYGTDEAKPFVEWGPQEGAHSHSPEGTLTFNQNSLCGMHTRWGIGFRTIHTYGVQHTNLRHLLILVKILCIVWLFLVTWERSDYNRSFLLEDIDFWLDEFCFA